MKFITEDELRCLHRKEGITEFHIGQDCRLTPGARQFLTDRSIKLIVEGETPKADASAAETAEQAEAPKVVDWKKKKVSNEITSIATSFMLTAQDILEKDVCLSQKLVTLERDVTAMAALLEEGAVNQSLPCEECTGITDENFSTALEDCFEITPFHMQVPKGREVLLLNKLRCAMHSLEIMFVETYGDCGEEDGLRCRLNQIRNSLSQMICTALGGKECQRKE